MGGGGSALRVCADHRGGINWLSLSPDGQRLLTGSEDGTARLWSTADGQCCALLQGHESYVTFCQLEDEAAFTCSADCTIRKWDVLTGQCLQVFRGHTSIVNRERFGGASGVPPTVSGTHVRCRPSLPPPPAGEPARVLGQRRQDGQVLAGRHGRACAHVRGPQTQRERPQVPRGHLVHGQRRRPRARLRRPVWSAAEGVPRPRLHHQLHPGARPGALHGLARRRAAPLGRARPPARPVAASRCPQAQPLAPLQQQSGLRRRRAPAAGLRRPDRPPTDPRRERGPPARGAPRARTEAAVVPVLRVR
ncbi:WD repeat-containing protein 86 isoform 3-T6 [Megaptera novaeangliae]